VRRSVWIPFLTLAFVLLAGLIVSGLQSMRIRAFAVGSPPAAQVAVLDRGQKACEGPIRLRSAVGGARFWGGGVSGNSWLKASVRDATTGRVMASGWTLATPVIRDYDVTLDGPIPAGSMVRVCVTGEGPARLWLAGSAPIDPQIVMSLDGKPSTSEFSLVLFQHARQSLLAGLPTAFSRAALFRFSWTGAWTFWVLTLALVGTIALCGWAVAAAARADSPPATRQEPTDAPEPREALLPLHLND
jgi:hypothetical protein